jgi:cytochrome c biogenesis protein CcmG/thiol:disulfide interchange protein DsbE
MRNKISAGDLLSAESILEVYRAKQGEDGPWLVGYAWLARGAQLLGDDAKAERYNREVYENCARRIAGGADLTKDDDVAYALGSAIEVEAQRIAQKRGARKSVEYVRGELGKWNGKVSFRSRLNKRIDLLTLEGETAPALAVEDFVGEPPPSLASLRGKPVILYVWDKGCGDCRAQAPTLVKAMKQFDDKGVQLVALTRFHDLDQAPVVEKARVDSSWNATMAEAGRVPIVVSDVSMERYGGSSTPTFVFIDRKGVVRRYTPTRLTEDELNRTIEALLQ